MHRIARRSALFIAAALALSGCSAAGATVVVTRTITSNPDPTTSRPVDSDPGGHADTAGSSGTSSPSSDVTGGSTDSAGGASTTSPAGSTAPTTGPAENTTTSSGPPPKPVHVSTFEGDGKTYGVGMAVMVLFSAAPTDSSAFTKAATVTIDGEPAHGAWFWQQPTVPGYAMEALYREQDYWPGHASIEVNLPVDGLSAGPGLVYQDSLSVTFSTGAAHVSTVNNDTHTLTVTSDGKAVRQLPVSLGAASTPTYDGTKVVMEKDNPERMKSEPGDPDPYDLLVPWSVRLTNSGEFIHAASWNTGNIGSRNTSHGCTNLDVADAKWFFDFSLIGDVVQYPDANPKDKAQPSWDGWGWWNLSWAQWSRGGMLLNH
jgi:lipoprotein-anchoring transpeptidase ErfK/SrfK